MYLLGFDIGSSSIKGALIDAESKKTIRVVSAPDREMPIDSPDRGFAEQDPEMWWKYVCRCSNMLMEHHPEAKNRIGAIGLTYQMHGLVLTDDEGKVLRSSVIWCDSRAVSTGRELEEKLDANAFLGSHYNVPGNFTFSKLRWVQKHQPDIFEQSEKFMLPGDYIAFRMTGEIRTSYTGLSEAILWNFKEGKANEDLLRQWDMDPRLIPGHAPSFATQGYVHATAREELGLDSGGKIPVSYRSGDQPNNAWSLNVNEPGVMAGAGGTSGVLYGISEDPVIDLTQRTNSFAHVNYEPERPRIGVLLCINGAGILYSWIRKNITGSDFSYDELERRATSVAPGADGLQFLPFGNGAERMLQNKPVQAHLMQLDLNRHRQDHIIRAGLEGVGFAFVYGYEIMKGLGLASDILRVGNDNLFLSGIFSGLISAMTGMRIEIREATGAVGAALGAGVGAGIYTSPQDAMKDSAVLQTVIPDPELQELYRPYYKLWKTELNNKLEKL